MCDFQYFHFSYIWHPDTRTIKQAGHVLVFGQIRAKIKDTSEVNLVAVPPDIMGVP